MTMAQKRTLDAFITPSAKKVKVEASLVRSSHSTYPFAVLHLPPAIENGLASVPARQPKPINDQPDLDLLYFEPFIPKDLRNDLFAFLRQELFFYRVEYKIHRSGSETVVRTPRYTTVFGVDENSRFSTDGQLIDQTTRHPVPEARYKCKPRPIPQCLDVLRRATEAATDATFNFCLVNFYADGKDSIAYHSDDEKFLGVDPAIASISLGARRDFLMKHKPAPPSSGAVAAKEPQALKLALGPGDMVLMRGATQANWLHSIPKRQSVDGRGGRINITFRKALGRGGTENYYQYNVGSGRAFQWNTAREQMEQMEPREPAQPA